MNLLYRKGAKFAKDAKKIKASPLFLHEPATYPPGELESDAG